MNSEQIFEYSEDFLKEIIDDLILLKAEKISNPKSNDFDNKLRLILAKNFDENNFKNILSLKDNELREKIINHFKEKREDRIKFLGENQSKEIGMVQVCMQTFQITH